MIMTPFDAYRTYLGIKRYFLSEDMQSITPPRNVSYDSFQRRNDAKMFASLCNKYQNDEDIVNLYVSNLLVYSDCWVGDLLTQECESNYTEWKKRRERMDYQFEADCTTIAEYLNSNGLSFDDLFLPRKNSLPLITKMISRKTITPETYAILDIILQFSSNLNEHYKNDLIWKTITSRYNKYKMFFSLDHMKIKKYKSTLLSKLKGYNVR